MELSNPRLLNALLMVILSLIWGHTWLAIKIGLKGIPPLWGVSIRFLWAGLILLGIAVLRERKLKPLAHLRADVIIGGLCLYCIAYVLIYWAEQHISSGLASVLFAVMPFYTALLAHFFIRDDRLNPTKLLGIAVGFAGIVYLFKDNLGIYGRFGFYAMICAALSPLFSSIGSIIHKKRLIGFEPIQLTAWQMLLAGASLAPFAYLVEGVGKFNWMASAIISLIFLSILGSAFAFVMFYHLLKTENVTRVSMIAFVTPLVAVITGHIAAGEPFYAGIVIGGSLVAIGVALVNNLHEFMLRRLRNYQI